jgi:hypothetical protein
VWFSLDTSHWSIDYENHPIEEILTKSFRRLGKLSKEAGVVDKCREQESDKGCTAENHGPTTAK